MFLAQHPDRGRTAEEIQELEKRYKSGEEGLPKWEERERTLRERQREDEDRRLLSRVQVESLRERGLDGRIEETAEERRERRRRREEGCQRKWRERSKRGGMLGRNGHGAWMSNANRLLVFSRHWHFLSTCTKRRAPPTASTKFSSPMC